MTRIAAAILFALTLAACPGNNPSNDLAPRPDAAACGADLASGDLAPIRCGPITCPAGKICVIVTPGTPPPPDAGNGYSYSCEDLPVGCRCEAARCGPGTSPAGCFLGLCGGYPQCTFDGVTLTCLGL